MTEKYKKQLLLCESSDGSDAKSICRCIVTKVYNSGFCNDVGMPFKKLEVSEGMTMDKQLLGILNAAPQMCFMCVSHFAPANECAKGGYVVNR